MYIEIIPYEKSFSTETLTYFVGASFREKIKIGQLVKIPYGKSEIHGIVAFFSENGQENNFSEIKEIFSIVSEKPILAEYQIQIILKISKKYFLAIHRVLGIFLPSPIIKRLYKKNFELSNNFSKKTKNFQKLSENGQIFLTKNDILDEEKILKKISENSSKKIIIIVPDDVFLHKMKNFFTKIFGEKVGFFSNEMTDTKKSDFWINLYNGEFDIVFGTRKIIFYNFFNYDEVWFLEDAFSDDFFHYPIEISYIDILAYLTDSDEFFIKIMSSIPRLKTLSYFHFFKIFYL